MPRAAAPVLLLLAACSAGTGDTGRADASGADSGPRTDAGDDGGEGVDLGAPPVDLGVDAGTSPCGTCPGDSTCGTAGGVPVCRAPSGVPRFTDVFVVVMENTSYASLFDADKAAVNGYIRSLVAMGASSTNYHGTDHPSLPNYIAMTSGADTSGIGCDCQPTGGACSILTCSALLSSCGCPQTVEHLGNQLEAAGLDWRDFAEDMGTPCNVMAAGSYAPKHVPFLYYPDVQTDAARCAAHVVDYGAFAAALAAPPAYSLIAPNLVHDMHDPITGGSTNVMNGDAWLSANVPPILASSAYASGGLLVVVWDEDDLSGVLAPDDPIPCIVLSPYAKHGADVATRYDHLSLLATIEDGLGLARLGAAAAATPMTDFFADP